MKNLKQDLKDMTLVFFTWIAFFTLAVLIMHLLES
jgi:hypothetical protein